MGGADVSLTDVDVQIDEAYPVVVSGIQGSVLTGSTVAFFGNTLGRALVLGEFSDTVLVDSTFSQLAGGAIESSGTLGLVNPIFEGNSADVGADLSIERGLVTVEGGVLRDGSATANGGSICIKGGELFVQPLGDVGTVFQNHSANIGAFLSVGGCQGASYDPEVTIDGASFTSGDAQQDGGAVSFSSGWLSVSASTFDNNRAIGDGGAISLTGPARSLTLDGVWFLGNHSGANGGAVSLGVTPGNPTIRVLESIFRENAADSFGGALSSVAAGSLELLQNRWCESTADKGGAVYVAAGPNVRIVSNLFFRNHTQPNGAPDRGDGVWLNAASYSVDFDRNTFIGHEQSISAYYNTTASLRLRNSVFAPDDAAHPQQSPVDLALNLDGFDCSGLACTELVARDNRWSDFDPLSVWVDGVWNVTGVEGDPGYSSDEYDCLDPFLLGSASPLKDAGLTDDQNPTDLGWSPPPDRDFDGFDEGSDCNDFNDAIHPDAAEIAMDYIDQDCDGYELCYILQDGDGDGFGSDLGEVPTPANEGNCPAEDCADGDADVHPGGVESIGNSVDENCDAMLWCYVDNDGDGHAGKDTALIADDADLGCNQYVDGHHLDAVGADCDDANTAVHPGAEEIVNDLNDDCDANGVFACHTDADGDGWGTSDTGDASGPCSEAEGFTGPPVDGCTTDCFDCDDDEELVHPDAPPDPGEYAEGVGGIDQDCDGGRWCFVDGDVDGQGSAPAYVATAGASCDGFVDDFDVTYSDNDLDCDDTDKEISKLAAPEMSVEIDLDANCDGVRNCYVDADEDGFGADNSKGQVNTNGAPCGEAYNASDEALSATDGDCDDSDPGVHPDAKAETTEIDVDRNCDDWRNCFQDLDDDQHGGHFLWVDTQGESCDGTLEYFSENTDCDESDPTVHAGATDMVDGVDQDCNGKLVCYEDHDGDGQGAALGWIDEVDCPMGDGVWACGQTSCEDQGAALTKEDCNDEDSAIFAGAVEVLEDGIDQDCDGADASVWVAVSSCSTTGGSFTLWSLGIAALLGRRRK